MNLKNYLTWSMTCAIIINMENSEATNIEKPRHQGDETHLLREIVRTHQVLMTGFSRRVGIPASRFALMHLLAFANENVGVMDLARHLGINAAAVTRQIKEMEKEGLVERRADPRDGRRNNVKLSPKGLAAFEAIHDRGHELERALGSIIDADKMAAAVEVLTKLRAFLMDVMKIETAQECRQGMNHG